MKFDVWLLDQKALSQMPTVASAVEALGFDGLWTIEAGVDGFFPLVLAAEHTRTIDMGTCIAVAFARNPTAMAAIGWDLARYSNGRFIMGLGTQVKPHIERRYGIPWQKPIRKLRESIEVMHTIWESWRTGNRPRYEGEFFNISLMTPQFSALPLELPNPPICISAVNRQMLKLAGKLCDGVILHPFHSAKYLQNFALPTLEEGLKENGRSRQEITINCSVFAVPTDGQKPVADYEKEARQQIGYYMSTPAYRVVSDQHGWVGTAEQLSKHARAGEWDQMRNLITDEMLDAFAVTGKWSELPSIINDRFGNMVDRTNYYIPFHSGEEDEGWAASVAGFRATD